jgi:hemerythrin-like domain-containing protein
MKPEEVRSRVLEDHAELRRRLDVIESLSARFEHEGASVAKELCDCAKALYEIFGAHLTLEDAHLVPALASISEVGERLAERLECEHQEQRELIVFLIGRIEEQSRPTTLVVQELKGFVQYLRADMAYEESTLLREDLFLA